MNSAIPRVLSSCVCAVVLGSSAALAAEVLQAPPEIMAQPDGSFSYEIALRKGPGSSTIGGYEWLGVTNVSGHEVGDGFCITTIHEGETLRAFVSARLTDPNLPGKVYETMYLCDVPGDDSTTIIKPFDPLDVGGGPGAAARPLWNEPNPFSRRTTFHYSLGEPGAVSLSIHDIAGRRVASVVDGEQTAGPHVVTWEVPADPASAFRGSVLFARLRVGAAVYTRRLILVQ